MDFLCNKFRRFTNSYSADERLEKDSKADLTTYPLLKNFTKKQLYLHSVVAYIVGFLLTCFFISEGRVYDTNNRPEYVVLYFTGFYFAVLIAFLFFKRGNKQSITLYHDYFELKGAGSVNKKFYYRDIEELTVGKFDYTIVKRIRGTVSRHENIKLPFFTHATFLFTNKDTLTINRINLFMLPEMIEVMTKRTAVEVSYLFPPVIKAIAVMFTALFVTVLTTMVVVQTYLA
ncbi:hypothetical protein AN391_01560 [Pseudoalteromonas sp. P1-13-1a]|uniref:hypothetical protein n=1 Tax=Pseudoalteromonas sp. P1-13-1a TaxID=1723756 RepID=UPI0006D67C1E|nr:hypothetical protein [Pseudoalteromonas sp. P1-13-1a]KPZ58878.1 hypothetical protein AN391_01560 [Pseudoalteromonas sp. P1-13-1a]